MKATPTSAYLSARVTKQEKASFLRRIKPTGVRESEILRIAVDEFFSRHNTAQAVIEAVVAHKSRRAA